MSSSVRKMIFIGCRQLGLNADARHDLQLAETGKASMTDMTEAELQKVLDRLKADGFKLPVNGGSKGRKHGLAPRADLRLVHVLWVKLGRAGKLKKPGRAGLNAFIRSSFGDAWGSVPADVDMLCQPEQITAVIQALKDWCQREGLDP